MVETMRLLKENEMEPEDIRFSPGNIWRSSSILPDAGTINSSCGKGSLSRKCLKNDIDPEKYVEEKGLKTVNDEGALRTTIETDHSRTIHSLWRITTTVRKKPSDFW